MCSVGESFPCTKPWVLSLALAPPKARHDGLGLWAQHLDSRGSGDQGHSQLRSKFETSQGSTRSCLKKIKRIWIHTLFMQVNNCSPFALAVSLICDFVFWKQGSSYVAQADPKLNPNLHPRRCWADRREPPHLPSCLSQLFCSSFSTAAPQPRSSHVAGRPVQPSPFQRTYEVEMTSLTYCSCLPSFCSSAAWVWCSSAAISVC